MPDYTQKDLEDGLRGVGVREEDAVFSLSNVGFFGVPDGGLDPENVFETVLGAVLAVLGPHGTFCAPAFTYSFCAGEDYDPDHTPAKTGMFPEYVRRRPGACRSHDPLFSVTALGGRAEELTRDAPEECFGPGSFWERFLKVDGLFCNFNYLMGPPLIHYLERLHEVPYRRDRVFTGTFVFRGRRETRRAVYRSRDLRDPDALGDTAIFEARIEELGLLKRAKVGRGSVLAIRAGEVARVVEAELKVNPRFLTIAGKKASP
ncbi:MAG: AAC(3) family N-acetyltransferase [Elusimicrobia bacterium]|nr:AAC(3) family N-acetyltransferase [Elusimicrobiota bacterium]